MTARPHFTQADIKRAVAGAIAGGMPAGSFEVRVDAELGVRIIPAAPCAPAADDLDARILALMGDDQG